VVSDSIGTRLAESFETALKLAEGLAYVDLVDASVAEVTGARVQEARAEFNATGGSLKGAGIPDNRIVFSEKFACPVSGFTIPE
ncbi:hypothetical protein, partial [Stenotrophomonas maltophilia]